MISAELPTTEQQHWRAYNFVPDEPKASAVALRRDFLAEFPEAEAFDLRFKTRYLQTSEQWERSTGWPIFLPLTPQDAHVLDGLRVPLTGSVAEFEQQVLNLAKLLIDSLNEKGLAAAIEGEVPDNTKGIGKLEIFLNQQDYPTTDRDVELLRTLQGIRSRGVAHRKSTSYNPSEAHLDPANLPGSFRSLLERGIAMLDSLSSLVAK